MTITVAQTDAEIGRCFPIMRQLRPHLIESEFVTRVRTMQHIGYLLAALEVDGGVAGVAGYRFLEKLFSGRNLYVDDLVTDGQQRSRGHGAALLAWLCAQAKAHDCAQLELDSGVQRFEAHRFYFRERLHLSAYHFVRKLSP